MCVCVRLCVHLCACMHVCGRCTYVPMYICCDVPFSCPADLFGGQPTLPTGSDVGDPWDSQYVSISDKHCSGGAAQLAFPSPLPRSPLPILSPSPSLLPSLSPPPPSSPLSPLPLRLPSSLLLSPRSLLHSPSLSPLPIPPPHSFPSTGFHNQYQLTLITVEKSNSQSGDYLAKVLKQKLYVSEKAALSWSLAGARVLKCCLWMVG